MGLGVSGRTKADGGGRAEVGTQVLGLFCHLLPTFPYFLPKTIYNSAFGLDYLQFLTSSCSHRLFYWTSPMFDGSLFYCDQARAYANISLDVLSVDTPVVMSVSTSLCNLYCHILPELSSFPTTETSHLPNDSFPLSPLHMWVSVAR